MLSSLGTDPNDSAFSVGPESNMGLSKREFFAAYACLQFGSSGHKNAGRGDDTDGKIGRSCG